MGEETAQGPKGKFVWYEYMGDDLQGAADFYADVVGWTVKDGGMVGFDYRIASVGAHGVAGLMKIPAEAKAMGAPACWNGYIWVPDVDAECEKLTAAGGRVMRPGADIAGVGRFAVVADPQGAVFMFFRDAGGNPPPPPPPGTAGLIGWHELATTGAAAALKFYGDTFGWKKDSEFDMGPMGAYNLFSTGHGEFGGIFTKSPQMPGPFWLYYFNVDAIDAAIERLTGKGGKVMNGPMEVPGGLWVVQAVDQQGGYFALVAPKR
jgi:predicted enzyme related to lactoylglutathione lyase